MLYLRPTRTKRLAKLLGCRDETDTECRELAVDFRVDEGEQVDSKAAIWGRFEPGGETQLQALGGGSAFKEEFNGPGRRFSFNQGDSLTFVQKLQTPHEARQTLGLKARA